MYKLYLDDTRDPKEKGWVVVRSFEEFVETMIKNGIPDIISFDHDLGWDKNENKERQNGV